MARETPMNAERYTISRPLPSEVETCWQGMQRERDQILHPPASLGHLVEEWGVSMLLFSGQVDGVAAALFLIRDPAFEEATGRPVSGWATVYVLPESRKPHGLALGRTALAYARGQGFRVLWSGTPAHNRQARHYLRALGFQPCGRLPGYATPQTLTVDAMLYAIDLKEFPCPTPSAL